MLSSAQNAWVIYRRVSTARQGQSGLGLAAQESALASFLASRPGDQVLAEFVEIESGKNDERPQLAKALDECRLRGARLLVSKLDRLSRDVHFLSGLLKSDVEILFAEMPTADLFRLHLEAVIAEDEARKISARTKAALAAAKRRGVQLGGFRGTVITSEAQRKGRASQSQSSAEFAERLKPHITELRAAGASTYAAIADGLTTRGVRTPRGSTSWSAMQARRVCKRLDDTSHA